MRHVPAPRALAILVVPALLAGCLAPAATPTPSGLPSLAPGTPPVVVAVVDTGINPYHARFQAGPSFADVPGFPANATPLTITRGAPTYQAAVSADAAQWEAVASQELVVFPGTRLAGISFGKGVPGSAHLLVDDHGHGTSTTDAVFEAAPHTVVLMIQIDDDETILPALSWAAAQPWIDVVSISWGKYLEEYAAETHMGLADGYRAVAKAGKIVANSAGNEPVVHWTDEHNGPPFVIAVGGAQNATQGETRLAARFPDVVAPFVQVRAKAASLDATGPVAGTSFACPTVAGTLAEAVWLVRSAAGATSGGTDAEGRLLAAQGAGALADGALTADEVRDAMNRRADVWGPTDWKPSGKVQEILLSQMILFAPAQMGWGYVEGAQAADLAAHLLGEKELPEKGPEFQAFMRAREAARYAIWGGI